MNCGLNTLEMLWYNSLIVPHWFVRTSPSIFWKRSFEIKDGLLLLCHEHQSSLRRIHGIGLSHFANSCHHKQQQFVNFHWTFTFCIEKPYDGTHHASGRTLDARCHFKHVSLKAGFTTAKWAWLTGKGTRLTALPNEHDSQVKEQGWQQCCQPCSLSTSIKNFPIGLQVMYLYLLDMPHKFAEVTNKWAEAG
jgi:hypothetical protein